jgi:hypothetical protein
MKDREREPLAHVRVLDEVSRSHRARAEQPFDGPVGRARECYQPQRRRSYSQPMQTIAVLALIVLLGCAGRQEPNTPLTSGDADGLTRCFASAYDEADKDAAFSACERKNLGTGWREKAKPKPGAPLGSGQLDPQIVLSGINARMGRMRACYAAGLRRDPTLRGEMKIKFVIDTSGHTLNVVDAGSHMKDKEVLACVMSEFKALRFPAPEGGIVDMVYPLVIGPGDTSSY